MSKRPITSKRNVATRFLEQVRFFSVMAKSPKTVGAITPTSGETADLMASHITKPNELPVLELGPGTGAITSAILRRGVAERDVYAVEYDAKFCRDLRERWPKSTIIQGNAFELQNALSEHEDQKFNCVISGLPLLNFEPHLRQQFLYGALECVPKGRPLIQFSYGISPPIETSDKNIQVLKSRWVIKNLPPARVWTYRYKIDA